ncbi:hypothetical protein SIID45300_03257 [Candidatus Magnetaquicoccaceae bacterium FCR-1]|uniref:Uncharacterized protein n=1 Tax=Candidatus Magnetaquiglobus chichijimensis TaxID=3141448 RepID=A0ABQ0CDE9_9PROT
MVRGVRGFSPHHVKLQGSEERKAPGGGLEAEALKVCFFVLS